MVVRGVPAWRRVCCCFTSAVAALCAAVLASAPAIAAPSVDNPIGVHSMLYIDHPFGAKQAMFEEAAAVGASTIRLDIAVSGATSCCSRGATSLRVLADLMGTPWYLTDCPAGAAPDLYYRCPPSDPALWGYDAGVIAAHTRGVIDDFEIINEPDGGWAFYGTPEQYAQILSASYDAIHAADPHAKVALGGLAGIQSHAWVEQVLDTPDADAIHRFDIANIHVRTPANAVAEVVREWRRYLAGKGFRGPLWVTETGYPADPTQQTDAEYQGGPLAQARWLEAAIPAMICAGAAKVFLTERDSLTGPYASEGFLKTTDPLPAFPAFTRRPSFYAIRTLADALSHHPQTPAFACPTARHSHKNNHRKQPRQHARSSVGGSSGTDSVR